MTNIELQYMMAPSETVYRLGETVMSVFLYLSEIDICVSSGSFCCPLLYKSGSKGVKSQFRTDKSVTASRNK